MKKKLIALLLITVMVFSMVACSKKAGGAGNYVKSDEPVTITYYYINGGGGTQQYTEQVEEKLNELLKTYEGYEHITIDLVPHDEANYQRDFTLAQSTSKQIDLVSTYGLDFNTMVKNGDFIELDELMEQFPDAVSEIPEWVVNYGNVHGAQYYIPTFQQAANLTYIAMPEEYLEMYMDAYGKTRDEVSKLIIEGGVEEKLDFMEDLCLAVREATNSDTKWINPGELWATNLTSNVFYNQEYIGEQFGHWILREGADAPEYFGYTEDYKTIMGRMAEWFEEGLLHPECTTVNYHKFIGENYLEDESYVFEFVTDTCTEEYLAEYMELMNKGIPMETFRVTDHAYIPSEWEAGGHAIYADCEHPVEAMMLIELLRTEKGKEFYNTLVYGLEGTHWEWEDKENERIVTLEFNEVQGDATTSYCCYKWNTGNVFNAWQNQAVLPGFYEYVVDEVHEGEDTVKSPAMGITWDYSAVKNQVSQCQVVEKEYARTIYISKDWEARYDEYIEKLEDAGVQDVLDELAKQYKEFKK